MPQLIAPFILSSLGALLWIAVSRLRRRTPLRLPVSLVGTLLVLLGSLLVVWARVPRP
ncbi:MAG: hypothetical protein M3Q71_22470 [Chloroflexota bacterium]|nr:hypothetical protein [Chloroflexota bacterium]